MLKNYYTQYSGFDQVQMFLNSLRFFCVHIGLDVIAVGVCLSGASLLTGPNIIKQFFQFSYFTRPVDSLRSLAGLVFNIPCKNFAFHNFNKYDLKGFSNAR